MNTSAAEGAAEEPRIILGRAASCGAITHTYSAVLANNTPWQRALSWQAKKKKDEFVPGE